MELATIDIVFVIIYLVAIAAIGLWYSRGVKTGKDLFLGGRSLPWWAVGTSLVVSDIGAKDMVGLADDGYRYGLVMTNFDFVGCIFPVLVAAFVFMPYLWVAGVYTIPEYLGRRYNNTVRTLFAVVWGVFMVGTLAVIFTAAATLFESLLGWEFWFSVVTIAVLVGIYTTLGGLKAVVITDFVSCIVLIVGTSMICYFGFVKVGGWDALQERIAERPGTEHHFEIVRPADSPNYSWPEVLLGLGFVLGPAYWIGNQAIVQRAFGTRTQNEARAAYVLCAAIKMIFPLLLVLPGMIGLALYYDQIGAIDSEKWKQGQVIAHMITLLPTGFLGIVMGAFVAGVMSNIDSYVNSASTLWVTDIYKPLLNPEADDKKTVTVGRWLVVIFLICGMIGCIWARNQKSAFGAFQELLSLFQGAILSLLLLGMLTRRATSAGGIAGMVIGISSAAMMHFGIEGISALWVAWWSFVAAFSSTIVVSLMTKPFDDERLRGLVYWLPAKNKEAAE